LVLGKISNRFNGWEKLWGGGKAGEHFEVMHRRQPTIESITCRIV